MCLGGNWRVLKIKICSVAASRSRRKCTKRMDAITVYLGCAQQILHLHFNAQTFRDRRLCLSVESESNKTTQTLCLLQGLILAGVSCSLLLDGRRARSVVVCSITSLRRVLTF